jgi:hypothetical protein
MKTRTIFNSGYISIPTVDSSKWIKDIQVGDVIKTVSGYRRVCKVVQFEPSSIPCVLDVCYITEDETLEKGYREDALHRITENSFVLCDNKVKKANRIRPRDVIMLKNGCKGKVTNIIQIPIDNVSQYFYSFELDKPDFFFADNVCVPDVVCSNNSK